MIRGLPQFTKGTCAEYALVDADVCAHKPRNVSHGHAASVPLVAITAIKGYRSCGLRESETKTETGPKVLVTGGAGGVGSVAIQLARHLYNASFIAATASAPKHDLLRSLGVDLPIDYRAENFAQQLIAQGHEGSFDVIFDCIGDARFCVPLLKQGGALTSIDGNPDVNSVRRWINESQISPREVTPFVKGFLSSSIGGGLFNIATGARTILKSCAEKNATYTTVIGCGDGEIMAVIARAMEEEKLRAVVDSEFALEQTVEAFARLESGHVTGKVLVRIQKN
eukprot:c17454_g1_i2.p1 GENE.c17454_g1_i2~~c17454_g1_i2.p1  ORF type:complete len:282 (+),score=65.30 c17454_g1_i2:462-1307(+)